MTFDNKDRAVIKSMALVGYAKSMPENHTNFNYAGWRAGLLKAACEAETAVNKIYAEEVI